MRSSCREGTPGPQGLSFSVWPTWYPRSRRWGNPWWVPTESCLGVSRLVLLDCTQPSRLVNAILPLSFGSGVTILSSLRVSFWSSLEFALSLSKIFIRRLRDEFYSLDLDIYLSKQYFFSLILGCKGKKSSFIFVDSVSSWFLIMIADFHYLCYILKCLVLKLVFFQVILYSDLDVIIVVVELIPWGKISTLIDCKL